jgi:hypothetical protein
LVELGQVLGHHIVFALAFLELDQRYALLTEREHLKQRAAPDSYRFWAARRPAVAVGTAASDPSKATMIIS